MENTPELIAEARINRVYEPIFRSDAKYAILKGGSGSGKSYAAADYIITTCITSKRRWIVARKYATTIRQSVFMLICRRISTYNLENYYKINISEMYITCTNGSTIVFVGLDDANKLKSIFDPTDAFIEEADQISQQDFEEIDRRIRTVGLKPRIIMAFNPTSIYCWIKKYFYDDPKIPATEMVVLNTTYRENKYIDPAYAATIERLQETNPSAYRVYGLGEWGIVEGVVFESWQVADVPREAKSIGYGMDFGFTNDPTTLVEVFETKDAFYYDEIIFRTGLTNPDISAAMKDAGISRHAEIIADSAEPKSIEELHRMGWNVKPCEKGADSVRFGIASMKSKKQFITPRSGNLQREFSSYTWRQDRNGRWLAEPVDMFNHGIDAIRYRVDMGRRRRNVGTTSAAALGL